MINLLKPVQKQIKSEGLTILTLPAYYSVIKFWKIIRIRLIHPRQFAIG